MEADQEGSSPLDRNSSAQCSVLLDAGSTSPATPTFTRPLAAPQPINPIAFFNSHPSLAPTEPNSDSLTSHDVSREPAPSPSITRLRPEAAGREDPAMDPLVFLTTYVATARLPDLPPRLVAHLEKRMNHLHTLDTTGGDPSAFSDLRAETGGLESQVFPTKGQRVLAMIERIQSVDIHKHVSWWHQEHVPVRFISKKELIKSRPDLFQRPKSPERRVAAPLQRYPTLLGTDPSLAIEISDTESSFSESPGGRLPLDDEPGNPYDLPNQRWMHHPNLPPLPEDLTEMQVPIVASGKLRFMLPARGFASAPIKLPMFDDRGVSIPYHPSPVRVKQEIIDDDDFVMDTEEVSPTRATTVETELEEDGMTDPEDFSRDETPMPPQRMTVTTGKAFLSMVKKSPKQAMHLGVGALVRSFSDILLESPQKTPKPSTKGKRPDIRGRLSRRTPVRATSRPFRSPSRDSTSSDISLSTNDYVHHLSSILGDTLLPTAHAVLDAACPQALYGWDWMSPSQAVSIAKERSIDASDLLEGRFENGGLKAWDCWVWGRHPTNKSGREPKLAGKGDENKYFLRGCWDEDSVKGKLGMLVVVQPEWALPLQSFMDFTADQEFTDGARGEKTFVSHEATWAAIHDVCSRLQIHFFVVTTWNSIAYGVFSQGFQVGYISTPIPTSPNDQGVKHHPGFDIHPHPMPNGLQTLTYWMRSSMGNCVGGWEVPEDNVLQVKDSSEYGSHFSHEQLWKTAEREPAAMESTKYVSRALKPLIHAASKSIHSLSDYDPINTPFHAIRKAQISQRADHRELRTDRKEPVRQANRGFKRSFEDRDRGGDDPKPSIWNAFDFGWWTGSRKLKNGELIGEPELVLETPEEDTRVKKRRKTQRQSSVEAMNDADPAFLDQPPVEAPSSPSGGSEARLPEEEHPEPPPIIELAPAAKIFAMPRLPQHRPSPPGLHIDIPSYQDDVFAIPSLPTLQTPSDHRLVPFGVHHVAVPEELFHPDSSSVTSTYRSSTMHGSASKTGTGTTGQTSQYEDNEDEEMDEEEDEYDEYGIRRRRLPVRACRERSVARELGVPIEQYHHLPTPTPTPPPSAGLGRPARIVRQLPKRKAVAFASPDRGPVAGPSRSGPTPPWSAHRRSNRGVSTSYRAPPGPLSATTQPSTRHRSQTPTPGILGLRRRSSAPGLGNVYQDDSDEEEDEGTPGPASLRYSKRRRMSSPQIDMEC